MSEQITYYAIVRDDETLDLPSGLIRRRITDPGTEQQGFVDEMLTRGGEWEYTDAAIRYFLGGSNDMWDLEEISAQQAATHIERWSTAGR